MKSRGLFTAACVIILLILGISGSASSGVETVSMPVLKWQHAGCYSSWCETGWYSSPAIADLDNDGKAEVIASPYKLFVLNGENGSIQWQVDPPGSRTWPGVVAADIDNNSDLEIVVAQGGGFVTVYDHGGTPVWSRRPSTSELRGLSAYDLDDDGTLEIIVTAAVGSKTNTWVLEHDGNQRPGWPQLSNDSGYAWGTYNDNATVGDLDGDGLAEIVVPSDVHYINAYEQDGLQIPAHPMYGGKGWGKVGVHVSHEVDLRGYAECGKEHRPNFAHTPASMVDVNSDGIREVVVTGNVYNCGTSPYSSLYEIPFIFNADRSRWKGDGFDWEVIPVPDGAAGPLQEDYSVIESVMANLVPVDLDGDGLLEILYPSYDGRLHAYWLDKSEHHSWPYDVNSTGPGIRFASEPVVADLDDDGLAEVIFTSWPQKGFGYTGKLHVLSYQGKVLHEIELPSAFGSPNWNGALAAPTIGDIDSDPDMELVLNTAHSGIVAYDLPGTAGARLQWATGRGNYQRTGSYLIGDLSRSRFWGSPKNPGPGDKVKYTIELINSGPALDLVSLANPMPVSVTFAGNLSATSGVAKYSAGEISWQGSVTSDQPVSIHYEVTLNSDITQPELIANTLEIRDNLDRTWSLSAMIMANGSGLYLPAAAK